MVRNEKSMKKSGTGIAIFAVVVALVGAGALPLAAHASTLTGPPNNLGLQAYYPFDEGVGTKALDHWAMATRLHSSEVLHGLPADTAKHFSSTA